MSHNHPLSGRTEQDILELTEGLLENAHRHSQVVQDFWIYKFVTERSTQNEDEFSLVLAFVRQI